MIALIADECLEPALSSAARVPWRTAISMDSALFIKHHLIRRSGKVKRETGELLARVE